MQAEGHVNVLINIIISENLSIPILYIKFLIFIPGVASPTYQFINNIVKNMFLFNYFIRVNIMAQKTTNNPYEEIMQPEGELQQNQEEDPLQSIIKRTKEIEEKQQILKYTLRNKDNEVKEVYKQLFNRKKYLLKLVQEQLNKQKAIIDIGLYQQFMELRNTIETQTKRIQQLRQNISKQGLTGVNNNTDIILLKKKREEIENDLIMGKKFISSQYVRDYLERPQVYKVSYEDVKYEYQTRLKVKQALEAQKIAYEKKKEQINKAIKKQKTIQQQLQLQRDSYLKTK